MAYLENKVRFYVKDKSREVWRDKNNNMGKDVEKLEVEIDKWIYEKMDESLPRHKFIYHCNLVYIDLVIDQKALFSPIEKYFLFSLDYNTHNAHKKLKEEKEFDYRFDNDMYKQAWKMMLWGFQYAMLCEIFPLLHSEKATMDIIDNDIFLSVKKIEKKNYKYLSDFSMRKALSYTLQMASGKLEKAEEETASKELADLYMHFWNENMLYEDFEPYTRLDYGGISYFFVMASMRRFTKIYRRDFDIVSLDSQKMMIVLSPLGSERMRAYVPGDNDELYKLALEDHVYKPVGKGSFPKLSVADASLNRTQDGYIYANPLVILSNDSYETQFLNYLRKCDNERYLRIKDKIKERSIPFICELVRGKFENVKTISNFQVKIPMSKKNRRECDLLLVDEQGVAIYLEIKHFYYPQSFCEMKKVDSEFVKALGKMPDQLSAITENWELIKKVYDVKCNLKNIYGVIVSHHYTGYDISIDQRTPIVDISSLYESIVEAKCLEDVYNGCREIDILYPSIPFLKRELVVDFAGYTFHFEVECMDPRWEMPFALSYRRQIYKSVNSKRPREYKTLKDLAHAYLESEED